MDRNHLNNFERGPTKDHSCEVWSNSHQWFRRRCFKIVDGRTSGRRRWTVSDHNSSPLAFGSAELIIKKFVDLLIHGRLAWPKLLTRLLYRLLFDVFLVLSQVSTRAQHVGAIARMQFLLQIYRACLTFFNKNSKSKKGHNCAKNILRVTSPIGMSYPFHNEQLVWVSSKYLQ